MSTRRRLALYSCALSLLAAVAPPHAGSGRSAASPVSRAPGTQSPREEGVDGAFDSVKTDPAEYIWPTDASKSVTSSFAEYRTAHFHGGIDISTHGHTGYKVFAARDGYVYRIRITPDGYGKMLYLRHRDGTYTTYAHLKTFNEEINRIVHAEQLRTGTFAVDLLPDSGAHQVNKGDVVAYTGDTGVGPPHLHFEIRDEHLNPVNPMLFNAFGVPDKLPPVIHRVLLSPLDFRSSVDNSGSPKIIRRFGRKEHTLVIPGRPIVHGTVGFGIDAVDRIEGTWSHEGIHRLELYLDDSLAFVKSLDRVPADETKEIDLDYDLPLILSGWGKFQKLYIEPGNSLPFYGNQPAGTGVIHTDRLSEGPHAFRIVCSDFHGNNTALAGTMIVNHRPGLRINSVDDDGVVLGGTDLDLIQKFHVAGRTLSGTSWAEHTIVRGGFESDATGIELPVDTRRYDVLRIYAETKLGSQTPPVYAAVHDLRGPPQSVKLKTEIFGEYVRFSVTSAGVFAPAPAVTVQEGDSSVSVPMQASDQSKYTGAYVPSFGIAGPRGVRVRSVVNGHEAVTEDAFTTFPVPSDRAGSFNAGPLGLRCAYDSGAVYRPMLVQVTSETYEHSTVYILEPQDRVLNKGLRISVPDRAADMRGHRGLFFRANGGWAYRTDRSDSATHSFTTTLTRTLGELAVLTDDEPPSIGRLRVSSPKGKPSVRFRYHDNLSGVDTDEIRILIDDQPAIPEIDGERHDVWYQAGERLGSGKHTVKITVKDRMKNQTQMLRTLTIR